MRRYIPLFFISFFMIVVTMAVLTYLSGYADRQNPENGKIITVYTTLPIEQVSLLSQEFEKQYQIRVSITPLQERELITRLILEQDTPHADLVLANRAVLEELKQKKMLSVCSSEQIDIVPDRFSDADSYWTGLWYDPIVFAANRDYLNKQPSPHTWKDLISNSSTYIPRLVITDFLAAEASANLLYTLVGCNGEAETMSLLRKIHSQIIQYSKFLSTPVRMAGLGECDIAIAVQSEAIRYINDGFPIQIFYPEDGTAFLLTGAGIIKNSPHQSDVTLFIDWLLEDNAQWTLQKNKFFFVPVNPESRVTQNLAMKSPLLLENNIRFSAEEQQKILNYWVQTVRLAPKDGK